MRMIGDHVVRDILQTAADVAPADHDVGREQCARPGERVVHRQKADAVGALQHTQRRNDRRRDVAVTEHNALALAGGAGGIDDRGQRVGCRGMVEIAVIARVKVGVTFGDHVIEIFDLHVKLDLDAVSLFHLFNRAGEILGIIDRVAARAHHDVDNIVVHELGVDGDCGVVAGQNRIEANDPIIAVVAEDRDLLFVHAVLIQKLTQPRGIIPHLVKALGAGRLRGFHIDILLVVAALQMAVFNKFTRRLEFGDIHEYALGILFRCHRMLSFLK